MTVGGEEAEYSSRPQKPFGPGSGQSVMPFNCAAAVKSRSAYAAANITSVRVVIDSLLRTRITARRRAKGFRVFAPLRAFWLRYSAYANCFHRFFWLCLLITLQRRRAYGSIRPECSKMTSAKGLKGINYYKRGDRSCRSVVNESHRHYSIELLPSGLYTLTGLKDGFEDSVRRHSFRSYQTEIV